MDASKIQFDRHTKRRMRWRRISEEEVYLAIESPDKIEESIKGRTNVYKFIGKRYIKVTYKDFSGQILVVSAVIKGERG